VSELTQARALKTPGLNGWVEAGLFVVALSVLNIVYAVAHQAGANAIVFVLYATAFASVGMLLLTGFGRESMSVLRSAQSWVYGLASVAMEGFYFLLLSTVSPAEASLTVRLTIPVSLMLGWFLFSRQISRITLFGTLIVIAAVLPVFWFLPEQTRSKAFILALTCAFIASIKTFASEFHPHNRAAETVMDKLRVTGLVVLATTIVGALILVPLSLLSASGIIPSFSVIPSFNAYWHGPTLLTAIGLGSPVLVAMNYLTFSSSVKITTENFLALSAFTPLGALVAQILAAWFGIITVPPFDTWLLVLIALGIAGMMIVIRGRRGVI